VERRDVLTKKLTAGLCVLAARLFGRRVPIAVTFRATYRCNFACPYCYVSKLQEDEMDLAQIRGIIDELAQMGARKLGITGGEPLLRDDIDGILAHARSRGLITVMTTNGSLVRQRQECLDHLDVLIVSFDGPPGVHDQQRHPGSHEAALDALRLGRERGLRVMGYTVITRANRGELDYVLDTAADLGFGSILQPAFATPFARDEARDLMLPPAEAVSVIDEILDRKAAGAPMVYSHRAYECLRDAFDEDADQEPPCYAGRLFCSITPSGNLFPCAGLVDRVPAVNAAAEGFRTAFERMRPAHCRQCHYLCYLDLGCMFSFDVRSVLNALRGY